MLNNENASETIMGVESWPDAAAQDQTGCEGKQRLHGNI